jgi:hypothetical protein
MKKKSDFTFRFLLTGYVVVFLINMYCRGEMIWQFGVVAVLVTALIWIKMIFQIRKDEVRQEAEDKYDIIDHFITLVLLGLYVVITFVGMTSLRDLLEATSNWVRPLVVVSGLATLFSFLAAAFLPDKSQ